MKKTVIVFVISILLLSTISFVSSEPIKSHKGNDESILDNNIINNIDQEIQIKNKDVNPKPIKSRSLPNSPWPMFGHDLNHSCRSSYNTSSNPGKLAWKFTTSNSIMSSPIIGPNGTIYFGSLDSKLYAINPNGTKKWSFTTGNQVASSLAISIDGTIYIGSRDYYLHAINPNGTKKWSFMTGYWVDSSPAIGPDGTIYVGSEIDLLFAINPDGTKKWSFTTGGNVDSSPAIGSNGTIYVGSDDGNLYAINPNGTKKWNYTTGGRVDSSPTIGTDGTIYVGSEDYNLYAIYPNGTKKWSFSTNGGILSSPAIGSDGTIYLGAVSYLYAINPNGTEKWSYNIIFKITSFPAIGSDGTIYVGTWGGNLHAINPTGTKKWNYKTGGILDSSPAIGSYGTIYIGCNDNKLYAFGHEPILSSGKIKPFSGLSNTSFNYTMNYLNKNNLNPMYINVSIDGESNYTMYEVDPNDENYFDGKDYYLNITNLDIGLHTYQFWTSNGYYLINTSIYSGPLVFNTNPEITTMDNITAIEDTYYEVNYQYEDIDRENVAQVGTWNFSSNATWLTFNPTTAMLYGTPTNVDVGHYWVNITINDTMDIDFTNFTLTVIDINDNPIITTTNIEITYEDAGYLVDYNATDIDSPLEDQIWSLSTNASSWLYIDSDTGVISGTPTNDEVGSYWVNVSVIDGEGGFDFTNFILIVLNVNDPPIIITEDVTTAIVAELYKVDYEAIDIDPPPINLIWSLNTNATWLQINVITGVLEGTPALEDLGWYNINVTVDDNCGGQDWHEFFLNVIKENLPPNITTEDVLSATVDELYDVDYDATDVDTPLDKLRWSLTTNASWLNINKITGVISGTPALEDLGKYWVNVTVTDEVGAFDFHNFTLTVYLTPNLPPRIITDDLLYAVVGEEYSVDYEAEDDRTPVDKLRWFLKSNASWLNINENTGLIYGIPELEHIGSYLINVSVFDGENGWDWHVFNLRVINEPIDENNKPSLSDPTMSPSEGDTETEFTFTVHYYDADTDAPTFIWIVIDNRSYNMTLKTGDVFNGTYEYKTKLFEGTHTYYFTASDGIDTVNTDNFTVYLEKPGKISEEETSWWWLILVIIVIIIVLIILFLMIRRKKKSQEEEEPIVEETPPPTHSVEPIETPPQGQFSVPQQVIAPVPSQTSLIDESDIEE